MFLKHSPGKQEVAHLLGLCIQILNVFAPFKEEESPHSFAPSEGEEKKKKSQRWLFLKYGGLSSAFLNDSVVPGFRLPLLHTAASGGEVVWVWNVSEL